MSAVETESNKEDVVNIAVESSALFTSIILCRRNLGNRPMKDNVDAQTARCRYCDSNPEVAVAGKLAYRYCITDRFSTASRRKNQSICRETKN